MTSCSQRSAAVCGRGEYVKEKTPANRTSSKRDSVAAKSSSVSPGKAHDHVRRKREVGNRCAEPRHEVEILRARVLAFHAPEDRVGARLDRQVQSRHDRGRLRHRGDEPVGEIARMRRHEAQAPESRQGADRPQEIGEILAGLGIAERVHGLAEELDLEGAARRRGERASSTTSRRRRLRSRPRVRGTTQNVQFLLQPSMTVIPARCGTGCATAPGVYTTSSRSKPVSQGRSPSSSTRRRTDGQGLDPARPEHEIDVREAIEEALPFLLRDAAADAEHGPRALALQLREAADPVVDLLLGLVAHGTGVEEDDVGFLGRRRLDDPFAPRGARRSAARRARSSGSPTSRRRRCGPSGAAGGSLTARA